MVFIVLFCPVFFFSSFLCFEPHSLSGGESGDRGSNVHLKKIEIRCRCCVTRGTSRPLGTNSAINVFLIICTAQAIDCLSVHSAAVVPVDGLQRWENNYTFNAKGYTQKCHYTCGLFRFLYYILRSFLQKTEKHHFVVACNDNKYHSYTRKDNRHYPSHVYSCKD